MNIQVDDIKNAISTLYGFKIIEETDDNVIYKILEGQTAILNKENLRNIIRELDEVNSEGGIVLFNNNSYEVLVKAETRMFINREISQSDPVNQIEYRVDKPSDRYLIFLLYSLYSQNVPRIMRTSLNSYRLMHLRHDPENQPLFDNVLLLLKELTFRINTLQIKSDGVRRKTEYEQLVYAFLFNLGYSTDSIIQPLRFIDEFIQSYRLIRFRRSSTKELDAPRRLYDRELVLHYQKGVASESIDHEYLSFYHVLEYFFERIYNEDIFSSIRLELTKPGFSYKRSKDISSLVLLIQKKLK